MVVRREASGAASTLPEGDGPEHARPMPGLVDVHSHAIPPGLPAQRSSVGGGRWPTVERSRDQAAVVVAGRVFRTIDSRCWSPSRRIDDLDAAGVDVQVVSPIPVTFCYDAAPSDALALARAQNDFLAEFVRGGEGRFRALGGVPLQDPETAVTELRRCVAELGFPGVEIGTTVAGRDLADPAFDDFFSAADELDALLLVHPGALPEADAARLAPLGLGFGVGMPCETAVAAAQLIVGGVLSARPRLKVCLAHGGGALPMLLGRLDRGYDVLPGMAARLHERPSVVARRLWADSLTYDPQTLALTLARFGNDHVVVGTDYPFAAQETPGATIRAARAAGYCDEATYRAVAAGNAATLLGTRAYEEVR
ncbi:MAG: aminocarboxymuconate-semialdehyde decarboxylase [Actinomycetota bacterium]|nr:aminocarboxymuconate-semialdehyde decarboxylase [Actinomycetota bacterium]